ncbi:MAG: hypothetical protein WBV82_05395 [Myxococcaceae bacterium]
MRSSLNGVRSVAAVLGVLVAGSALAQERIGVGFDPFFESSTMSGEQSINISRFDESFDYGAAGGAVSAWLLWSAEKRVRVGPGLRVYGNYGSGDNPQFIFGFLTDAFAMGEYSLNVIEKFDVIFGGRAGLSVLVPGQELSSEIQRLRLQGVDAWNVPRLGWLAGLSLGTRRQMSEKIWLRADFHGEYTQLFLFATHHSVDGFDVGKAWNTHSIRLGLLLGAEFSL